MKQRQFDKKMKQRQLQIEKKTIYQNIHQNATCFKIIHLIIQCKLYIDCSINMKSAFVLKL